LRRWLLKFYGAVGRESASGAERFLPAYILTMGDDEGMELVVKV